MSSYLDKTGLERVWSKATDKFATIVATDELGGRILNLETNSATKQEVSDEVAKLVDSAPETLNTLNELAAALGDDPNFATTMATEIGKKVNSSDYNDAIGSINSHINTINGEIDELQEASEQHLNKEDYLGPVVKEGNPIVYDNGVEGFDIKVETTFGPKQAGSGDPYPAGGGKNLINVAACTPNTGLGDRTITISGEIVSVKSNALTYPQAAILTFDPITLSAGTYTFVLSNSVPVVVRANNVLIVNPGNLYETKTFSEAVTIDHIAIEGTEGQALDVSFGICVRADDVDEYVPAANIRPFIGYDKLGLTAAGKNLCPTGSVDLVHWAVPNSDILNVLNSLPAGTYTFSAKWKLTHTATDVGTMSSTDLYGISFYCGDANLARTQYEWGTTSIGAAVENSWSFTIENEHVGNFTEAYLYGVGNNQVGATGYATIYNIQIEAGSATTYKPYSGKTYTLQFGETIYGGSMDWNAGEMTVKWKCVSLTANNAWSYTTSEGNELFYLGDFTNQSSIYSHGATGFMCSHYPISTKIWNREESRNKVVNTADTAFQPGFAFTQGTYGSLSAWKSKVTEYANSGNPLQLAFPVKTPYTIQLTPTQISELEGINTLYGDGDSIHAIFKSTGGTSTTLETISGVLSVEKGGTGATSAAGARNNLGITPENIGALSTNGGTIAGTLTIGGGTEFFSLNTQRIVDGILGEAQLYTDAGAAVVALKHNYELKNFIVLREHQTELYKALTISSGGTGATTAADARTNLDVPSRTGSGASGNWSINITGNAGSANLAHNDGDGNNIASSYLKRYDWWSQTDNHNIDDLKAGITFAYLDHNAPTTGTIAAFSCKSNENYSLQIMGSYHNTINHLYFRNRNGDSNIWGDWRTVLDNNNYTDYTVTKTGSGASGTWGINVTGYSKSISYPAQLTTDDAINAFNAANTFQVTTWNSTDTPGVSNGILISTGWENTSYGAQIAIDDDPTYYIALRQRNSNSWNAWKRIPMGDGTGASGSWGISVTGSSGSCTGNAATATLATTVGTSDMKLYAHNSNEVNFGGTNDSSTIYFGYRALDSKPIPTQFIFGGSSGTADLRAKNVYLGSGTSSYITASSYTGNAATATTLTTTLEINKGGTGATNKSGARTNLGITSGTTLPSSASAGDIFFLYS